MGDPTGGARRQGRLETPRGAPHPPVALGWGLAGVLLMPHATLALVSLVAKTSVVEESMFRNPTIGRREAAYSSFSIHSENIIHFQAPSTPQIA